MARRLCDVMSPAAWWRSRSGAPAPSLGDAVHLWSVRLDLTPPRVASCTGLLAPDEGERAARFCFERDRRHFVVCRAALRVLLGAYLSRDPSGIRLTYGPHGKPALLADGGAGLRFNVSHAGGRALLAFALRREVGVDLELERPVPEMEDIARRYFSGRETRALFSLPRSERQAAFFRCWTRKEAFLKATGDGLARPLDAFDVSLAPGAPARLLSCRDEPGEVRRWWLEHVEMDSGFHAGLAVEGEPSRVDRLEWSELEEESDGARGERRRHGLQGRAQPRGAVLDLAR